MWRNNGLSIVMFLFFALTLGGQSYAGWKTHNEEQTDHGKPEISYGDYLASNDFAEAVFENWESEFLQMAAYIVLTVFLYQKGSSESKKHDGTDEVDDDPLDHRNEPGVPGPVKAGGIALSLYKYSLSIAFVTLFLVSFWAHAASGARKYSEQQREHGSNEVVGTLGYMAKPRFWSESLQNWQSEFLAMFAIVVLSIWLRQWGSPESKPVHAPHSSTGTS